MATGREYLQSIIASAAKLQNLTDNQLEQISDGLKRVDEDLQSGVSYVDEWVK